MLPVIAIVGRPNVGKSTLFNRLTKTQNALVIDFPGVTRDRIYGEAKFNEQSFIVIDTGGLVGDKEGMAGLVEQQSWLAVKDADVVFFVVDGRAGLTGDDEDIALKLRSVAKPIYILINKAEDLAPEIVSNDFYKLGFPQLWPISASHNQGVNDLLQNTFSQIKIPETEALSAEIIDSIKVAIIGRPNAGKSTLINRLLGESRVVVSDQPGTTRDSIYIPFQRGKQKFTLIDTAGVRRRRGVTEFIEKISVIKTLQAIAASNVVILVLDAQENVTEQDLRLLGFALEAGKALVIAVNKWDDLPTEQREKIKQELDRRLSFVSFAKIYFISALHGTAVGDLWGAIQQAYRSATREIPTHDLTRVLELAVTGHQPPAPQGRVIKLRYAHSGGHNPPVIVIHGKQTDKLPNSYVRYLENYFRDAFHLVGTPIRIEFKQDVNPFYKGNKKH
jgi:GTP-binding protein